MMQTPQSKMIVMRENEHSMGSFTMHSSWCGPSSQMIRHPQLADVLAGGHGALPKQQFSTYTNVIIAVECKHCAIGSA
jgi:hypothetical protein